MLLLSLPLKRATATVLSMAVELFDAREGDRDGGYQPNNFFCCCLNSFVVYIYGQFFSLRDKNVSVTVVHLLEWPTLVLCSSPRHKTKGHHVPHGLCDHEGSSPALGGLAEVCFGLFFCGCGSSNLEPPTMGIAVALLSIAAAIPLRWW